MGDYGETRSVRVATWTAAMLGTGVVLGYALPWVTSPGDSFGDGGDKFMLADISTLLDLFGRGWILTLAQIGVLLAVVAAVAMPRTRRRLQAICISAGAVTALALPIYVGDALAKLDSGDSAGSGLALFAIAAAAAAIFPWIELSKSPRQSTVPASQHRSFSSASGILASTSGATRIPPRAWIGCAVVWLILLNWVTWLAVVIAIGGIGIVLYRKVKAA